MTSRPSVENLHIFQPALQEYGAPILVSDVQYRWSIIMHKYHFHYNLSQPINPCLPLVENNILQRLGTYNAADHVGIAWRKVTGKLRNLSVGKTIVVGTNSANDVFIIRGKK